MDILNDTLKATIAKIAPSLETPNPSLRQFPLQRPYVIYFLPSNAGVQPGVKESSDGALEKYHLKTVIFVKADRFDDANYIRENSMFPGNLHMAAFHFHLWAVDIERGKVGAIGEIDDDPLPNRMVLGPGGHRKEAPKPEESTVGSANALDHMVDLRRWADSVTDPEPNK